MQYNEMSEQTKQNFMDAFWQLYEKKDINRIRVQEICELAGYHRSTFYHHFSDVYNVLEQIEDNILNELIDYSDEKLASNFDFPYAKRFAEVYEKNKKYLKLLADEEKGSSFPYKMRKRLKPFYDNILVFSDNEEENAYIHEYKLSGSISAIMYYFKSEKNLSIEDVMNIVLELASTGKYPMRKI